MRSLIGNPEKGALHLFSVAVVTCCLTAGVASPTLAQGDPAADTVKVLVERLDLEKYKATVQGLTQFGDRRQGTDRNRAAIDWIEAQLKSYGCPTERIRYDYQPASTEGRGGRGGGRGRGTVPGGGRPRGIRTPTGVNTDPTKQP